MTTHLAVYLPVEGLDISAGVDALTTAGWDVRHSTIDRLANEPFVADVTALLVGYDRISGDLLNDLPSLQVIATHSAGVDMVDVDAALSRGVVVRNVPAAATEEVAVHSLALALALLRALPGFDAQVRRGEWESTPARVPPRISTTTLGIVGLGRIGRHLATIAAPLFGEVIAYDPALPEEAWPAGIPRVDLPELVAEAHCISLHVPLTAQTHHLIGAAEFAQMREGAVLINTARAGLVDHGALRSAIDTGRVAAAGLDVLPQEPPAGNEPLIDHPSVLLTPHIAFLSNRSLREYVTIPAQAVIDAIAPGHQG